MADPVSWYVIDRGWDVQTLDGSIVGTVDEVLGDEELDIFNGLAISLGIGRVPRYVPADAVGTIEDGRVTLSVLVDEVGSLPASSGDA